MYLSPPRKVILDTYHPKDCTTNLAAHYQYVYSNNPDDSQITVLEGYYSKVGSAGETVNSNNNDAEYALEGNSPNDELPAICNPAADDCRQTDFGGANPFRYRVYYPNPTIHDYDTTPLLCIVMFHPGGFMECSNYLQPMMQQLGEEWSRKGFIYFTVEYRRGRAKDIAALTSVQQQMASYRAIQDGCGAIRSIIKKNRDGSFDFKINENQFFIGGASAGGIAAMGCAYYRTSGDLVSNQGMIDEVFKKATGSTHSIKQILGNMHSDYYYAPVSPDYWPVIRGVICMWSGISIPYSYDGEDDRGASEKEFFKANATTEPWANPPMIAFHGDDDTVFPFYDGTSPIKQDINLSPTPDLGNNDYNSSNLCTIQGRTFKQYIDPALNDPPELKMCSSLNMTYILYRFNRYVELYLDCDMAHGLDNNCEVCPGPNGPADKKKNDNGSCSPCVFNSDFGTGFTNTEAVITYMANKVAVFLQTIMNYTGTLTSHPPVGYTGRFFFKECVNNREVGQGNNNTCTNGNNILCDGSAFGLE